MKKKDLPTNGNQPANLFFKNVTRNTIYFFSPPDEKSMIQDTP